MIILHVPHASTLIPQEYRNQFILNDQELEQEAFLMADINTDLFVEHIDHEKIIFPYSRLVCDVERFRDDADEIMSQRGMGVVYTVTHDLKPLRKKGVHSEKIKETLYDPHHTLFTQKVNEQLAKHNTCWIIDLHSYADKALPYELFAEEQRPDICLGFEDFHVEHTILEKIKSRCEKIGSVGMNTPFKGSIVPLQYYNKDKRVQSIMIEINKRLYLDNPQGVKQLQILIQDICTLINSYSRKVYKPHKH